MDHQVYPNIQLFIYCIKYLLYYVSSVLKTTSSGHPTARITKKYTGGPPQLRIQLSQVSQIHGLPICGAKIPFKVARCSSADARGSFRTKPGPHQTTVLLHSSVSPSACDLPLSQSLCFLYGAMPNIL